MRNIHKILNTELTNKEIAAIGSDIITDSMFGVLPAMSLHKSEEEGRSKESSVIHAFGAIGAATALDFAEDKIVEKTLGSSSSQVFGKILENNKDTILNSDFTKDITKDIDVDTLSDVMQKDRRFLKKMNAGLTIPMTIGTAVGIGVGAYSDENKTAKAVVSGGIAMGVSSLLSMAISGTLLKGKNII